MQSLSHLTNDELINQALMHNDLTPLERELLRRLLDATDHLASLVPYEEAVLLGKAR